MLSTMLVAMVLSATPQMRIDQVMQDQQRNMIPRTTAVVPRTSYLPQPYYPPVVAQTRPPFWWYQPYTYQPYYYQPYWYQPYYYRPYYATPRPHQSQPLHQGRTGGSRVDHSVGHP